MLNLKERLATEFNSAYQLRVVLSVIDDSFDDSFFVFSFNLDFYGYVNISIIWVKRG